VSQYQKGKTNLDLMEQEIVSGRLAVASDGPYANLHLITDNHASLPPLIFYRPDALPVSKPTALKH